MRRKTVAAFAKDMDRVLDQNASKGGWKGCSIDFLKGRLIDETFELVDAIGKQRGAKAIRKECVDIANFAMMLWDVTVAQLKKEGKRQ